MAIFVRPVQYHVPMASIEKHPVFYLTLQTTNLDSADPVEAKVDESFQTPILYGAENYVCAVERFSVHLNGVPFYDGTGEQIQVIYTDEGQPPVVLSYYPLDATQAASLADLMAQLFANRGDSVHDGGGDNPFDLFNAAVDPEGRVTLTIGDTFADVTATYQLSFALAPKLIQIVGSASIFPDPIPQGSSVISVTSDFPRFDIGDAVRRIRVSSNLPVISDIVGQSRTNIITDLDVVKSFSTSADDSGTVESFSYSPRQRVEYLPFERRFLNMRSGRPIENITVNCEYVDPFGISRPIVLPLGCSFSIKIGFWSLNSMPTPHDTNFNMIAVDGRQVVQF